jgi:hypothetical protein
MIKAELEQFLINNPELEQLTDILNSFNIYDVLKVTNQEIRHSNTLAWLFDPKESHGFQDKFLSRFLSYVLASENNDREEPSNLQTEIRKFMPTLGPELNTFEKVTVLREYKNIDVLIKVESFGPAKEDFAILIENKVQSKQSKGQLKKYYDACKKEFKNIIPIFLTLNQEEPEEDYFTADYEIIYNILKQLLELYYSQIPSEQQIFLSHYTKILGRLTMNEKEISDLCKTIYSKHKNAIDEIMRHASNARNNSNELFEEYLQKNMPKIKLKARAWGAVFFLPEVAIFDKNYGQNKWDNYYKENNLLSCDYYLGDKKKTYALKLILGNIEDKDTAVKVINALNESGLIKRKLDPEKTYAQKTIRLLAKKTSCSLDDNDEIDLSDFNEKIEPLFQSFLKEIEPICEVIKKAIKK